MCRQTYFLCVCVYVCFRLWFLWPEDKYKRSRNRCGCLGGCRFFGGSVSDFFRLEEITPSSSSAFSSVSAESDMSYGQSLLHPGEWIVTKEIPKLSDCKSCLWLFTIVMLIGCQENCTHWLVYLQLKELLCGETRVPLLRWWTWRDVASTSVSTYLNALTALSLPLRRTLPPVLPCLC